MMMHLGLLFAALLGFVQSGDGEVARPDVVARQLDHLRGLTARLRRSRPDVFGGEAGLGPRLPVALGDGVPRALEGLLNRELLLLEQTVARLEGLTDRADDVHASAHTLLHQQADYALELPADRAVESVGLLIENLGRKPVIAPRVARADAGSWHDLEALTRAAVGDAEQPEDVALALWRFLVLNRDHAQPAHEGAELHDPVKLLNVYGYGLCDDAANAFAHLARAAGLQARVWGLGGHVVAEAFYDGSWHLFDPDHEVHYRDADGRVLGVEQLAARPELLAAAVRVPGRPVYSLDMTRVAAVYASTDDNALADYPTPARFHEMDVTLREGERVMLWAHAGPRRVATTRFDTPAEAGNGEWLHEFGVERDALVRDYALPWPLLGGRIELVANSPLHDDSYRVELRDDDDTWVALPSGVADGGRWRLNLDAALTIRGGEPRYALELRVVPRDDAPRANALVALWFQHAPRALPALEPGRNALRWNARGGAARVTHLYRVR